MSHYIAKLFILGAFLFLGMAADIRAAGGNLDTGFNGIGKSVFNIESSPAPGGFADVVVIGGNKFLVTGRAEISSGSYYAVTLIRFNSDGSLDTSFGSSGKVITDLGVTSEGVALAVQSDGKILVAASSGQYPRPAVVLRYNADGTLDTTFGSNGILSTPVEQPEDILVTADNKILIAGTAGINNPNPGAQIAKLNSNGTLDTSFGSNGMVTASRTGFYLPRTDKIAIQPDGRIVLSASASPTVSRGQLYRFNTDGSIDNTFGTGGFLEILGNTEIYLGGLGIQPDGKIVVGGFAGVPQASDTQLMLTRLNSDGSTDASFGGGMVLYNLTPDYDRVSDMLLQSDGKILIGGQLDNSYAMLVRFDSAGAIDTTFGKGGVAQMPGGYNVSAVALQGANLVAIGDANSTFLARLSLAGTTTLFRTESFVTGKNDQARDVAIQPDGKIVTAGVSINANTSIVSVARLLPNGSLDTTFGNGGRVTISDGTSSSEAFAVDVQPDGKIVVAGRGSQFTTFTYYSLFVARLNADGSLDNTFGNGGKVIITNPRNLIGYDMELQPDGKIVVGGTIYRVVGDGIFEYDMIAVRLNPNGTLDGGFSGGIFMYLTGSPAAPQHEQAKAISIQPDGKIILAGTHLLRLDPNGAVDATFSPVPVSLGFMATDMKLQPDGKILLSALSNSDFTLVRYNSNASIDTNFGVNGIAFLDFGGSDGANAIYLDNNGDIFAGGSTLGGSPSRRKFALARFKPDGSPDSSFGNGGKIITDFGGDAQIFGLTRQNDGKIVAAGEAKVSIDRDYALARYFSRATQFDFDGDNKTDISIFRPSNGQWWYLKSSNGGNAAFQFGNSSDKMAPADFTGDGRTDVAIFRPVSGEWFILRSEDNSYYSYPFGTNGDIPSVGDFDNDGKADAAVFRPSSGTWYIHKSSGGTIIEQFGISGDVPVVADYDADGKSDIAIWRASAGQWWIQRSTLGTIAYTFGNSADKPVQGDYTGDGKADVAVYRPSTGEWFILRSENFSYYAFPFGTKGDIPSPGDFDGDGVFDAAVFRPTGSTWYVRRSTAGTLIQNFGLSTDKPVPNAFVP
ncbi:MAG: FG-GAP-like repeat-containing protein [Pyrinomonadaceae bacterium]